MCLHTHSAKTGVKIQNHYYLKVGVKSAKKAMFVKRHGLNEPPCRTPPEEFHNKILFFQHWPLMVPPSWLSVGKRKIPVRLLQMVIRHINAIHCEVPVLRIMSSGITSSWADRNLQVTFAKETKSHR
ncbi:hypothetical protein MTP99_004249 [Tenebrio molitor]|nr:hypothetical protein MTP99_004249 [Tenebrio molitor]